MHFHWLHWFELQFTRLDFVIRAYYVHDKSLARAVAATEAGKPKEYFLSDPITRTRSYQRVHETNAHAYTYTAYVNMRDAAPAPWTQLSHLN